MATKATPVTEAEKGQDGVQEVTATVPGVGPVTTYFRIEYVDDLTGKPGDNTRTVTLRFPYEDEQEKTETDADGNTVLNGDGTEKIVMEKFIGYETMDVDLSDPSLAKLIKALEPFYKVARATPSAPLAPVRTRTGSGASAAVSEWNRRVRSWAQSVGHTVADRGQLKAEITEAYSRANPNDPKPK